VARTDLPDPIAERLNAFDDDATGLELLLKFESIQGDVYLGDCYLWLTQNTGRVAIAESCDVIDGYVARDRWVESCS